MADPLAAWTPPPTLLDALADGDGAVITATERGLSAHLTGLGLGADAAARMAASFVEAYLGGLAAHDAPDHALAAARAALAHQIEHALAAPPAAGDSLLDTLAQGGDPRAPAGPLGILDGLGADGRAAAERAVLHGLSEGGGATARLDEVLRGVHGLEQAGLGAETETSRLLSALALGGPGAADALHRLSAGVPEGAAGAFQQTLLDALGHGVAPDQALYGAGSAADHTNALTALGAGPETAESRLMSELATGGPDAAAALAGDSGLDGPALEHMVETLDTGDHGVTEAMTEAGAAHEATEALAAAGDGAATPGGELAAALASGEGAAEALGAAGGDHAAEALAQGQSPDAAIDSARAENQMATDLAQAAAADGHADPLIQALASGEDAAEMLNGMAGAPGSGQDAFVATLLAELAQGVAPETAAGDAHASAEAAEAETNADHLPPTPESEQALALAGGEEPHAPKESATTEATHDAPPTPPTEFPPPAESREAVADGKSDAVPVDPPNRPEQVAETASAPTTVAFQDGEPPVQPETPREPDQAVAEALPAPEDHEVGAEDFEETDAFDWILEHHLNTAPVLTPKAIGHLPPLEAGGPAPTGARIGDLIPDNAITDAESGPIKSIAVTGVDDSRGYWQFQVPGGSDWTSIDKSALDGGHALLLDADDRLRFVPSDAQWSGANPPSSASPLTFVGWDKSEGTAGQFATVVARGASSPFSVDTGAMVEDIHAHTSAPAPAETPVEQVG